MVNPIKWFQKKELCNAAPEWEYISSGWQPSVKNQPVRGWNAAGVARSLEETWPLFLKSISSVNAFGLSNEAIAPGVPDLNFHNNVMNFAYVLSLAGSGKKHLRILDWGGGIGHYYKIAQTLFPDLHLDYTCADLPELCKAGARLNPDVRFVCSEEEYVNQKYDLVMSSSSLHYSENWRLVLKRLCGCTGAYVFVTRLPVIKTAPSYVVIQRPYQYGYDTEYLGWCLNQKDFLDQAQDGGAELQRIFLCGESLKIADVPEQAFYRGFLFKIKAS